MNEIITIGGAEYITTKVSTGIESISFVLTGLTEEEAKTAFESAKSLSVGDENGIYGEYPDVEFESIMIDSEGSITVTMYIPSKMEKQIRDLQEAVAEHDEAIAAIMFGGEAE